MSETIKQETGTPAMPAPKSTAAKSLGNTTASGATKNVPDIKFWGNGDTFKLISKAHSVKEGWMKSTKAMDIHGTGCVIQVSTQQGSNVAEAVVFVPGVKIYETIKENEDGSQTVLSREIVRI